MVRNSPSTSVHAFDRDTALTLIGTGNEKSSTYLVNIGADWQVFVGPNGGYIAAIILNGMKQKLESQENTSPVQPRSITYHFLSASVAGQATLDVKLEKLGRTLTSVTATLCQGGKTIAIALASFADTRVAIKFSDFTMPEITAPEDVSPDRRMKEGMHGHVPFRDQFDQRIAIGPVPGESSDVARVGGWTRFIRPRQFDDLAIVAISDSWYPGLFTKNLDPPMHCPTVDHTVHFLANSLDHSSSDEFLLVDFETSTANDGYLVEDGCIWAKNGTLLARSRQLAIILPH